MMGKYEKLCPGNMTKARGEVGKTKRRREERERGAWHGRAGRKGMNSF